MKRAGIIRYGAYGDLLVITPVLRYLAKQGYHLVGHFSERGMELLEGNPYVKEWIPYASKSIPEEKLVEFWKKIASENGWEETFNLTQSLEVELVAHPSQPRYNYPKDEREKLCSRSFYETAFSFLKLPVPADSADLRGEIFYTPQEETWIRRWMDAHLPPEKRLLVVGWSGSGLHKVYPFMDWVVTTFLDAHPEFAAVSLGDDTCRLLENDHPQFVNLAADIPFRKASILTREADLMISTDTGLLHSAGCYDTPKVGVIGHHHAWEITKHFANDFSVEADHDKAECSPCWRLVYSPRVQCPQVFYKDEAGEQSESVWCMYHGIEKERVLARLEEAANALDRREKRGERTPAQLCR